MEFHRSKILFCCFLILLFGAFPSRGELLAHESEFSYDEESPIGPSHWGEIKPEWHMCSTGKMQSPIDLLDCKVLFAPELGRLHKDYKPSFATLVNRGYDTMLQWVHGGGYIFIDGTPYQLKQCHWHAPSEHLINGRRFDLEIHLVHQSLDGKIAVIGMVYEIGPPDPFLSVIEHDIKDLASTIDKERPVGIIDPERINIGSGEYYRYMGSLTTPPCSEDVIWTVMEKVNTVSKEQVELIREAIHDETKTNARPVQPLNNRLIKFYKPITRINPMGDIVAYMLRSLDKSL